MIDGRYKNEILAKIEEITKLVQRDLAENMTFHAPTAEETAIDLMAATSVFDGLSSLAINIEGLYESDRFEAYGEEEEENE